MYALARLQRLILDPALVRKLAPGVGLAILVMLGALAADPVVRTLIQGATGLKITLPAIVLALIIGMAFHRIAIQPAFTPGITWCVKSLLRFAVGLLGLRIALGDIVGLGFATGTLVIVVMAATIASAMLFARWLGCSSGFGALSGAANAVCGASAALATATVVPEYKGKDADVVLTVVMANAISTLVMIAYPPLCQLLGFGPRQTGVMLGATIQDMAQVVGAGYSVSDVVGDAAVVVKMFRVFLLLPVVLAIGWWFHSRRGASQDGSAPPPPPVPTFALAFLALCVVNSALSTVPFLAPVYGPVKSLLTQISSWSLLIAIAALGLGTSLTSLLRIDWRQLAVFIAAMLVTLVLATAGVAWFG